MKSVKTKTKSVTKALLKKIKPAPAPEENGVPIQFVAPSAKEVCVVGTFNDWQATATPLKAAKGGVWMGELKLKPGRYEYLFVVDGKWMPDPAAPESVPNPFGGLNSVVSVS
jgi:1,4-alpha-glucan branching enzyme